MWRIVVLVVVMGATTLMLRAEGGGSEAVSAALVQVQDCLDMGGKNLVPVLPEEGDNRPGLTLGSLFATLAIGCLSILFCVPAALVAEYFFRRSDGDYPGTAP